MATIRPNFVRPTSVARKGTAPRRSTVTTSDGVSVPLYRWPVDAPMRATVALVHGLAEHAGRYAALADHLNSAGIEVVAIDLRGHGDAPGKRAYVNRFDEYLLDMQALLDDAAQSCAPLFLMGHSMGGAVAALYAIECLNATGRRLNGLILSRPALDAEDESGHQPVACAAAGVSRHGR